MYPNKNVYNMKTIMILPEKIDPVVIFPSEVPKRNSYSCHVLCKQQYIQPWKKALRHPQIEALQTPESLLEYWKNSDLTETYDLVRSKLINDFMTFSLLERGSDTGCFFSFQKAAIKLEKLIFAVVHYLSDCEIDELIYINSGEYLEKYVLIKSAEAMNIKVSRIRPTILPYRVTIDTNEDHGCRPSCDQLSKCGKQTPEVDFIKLNQGSYEEAIPENSRAKVNPKRKTFYRFLPGLKAELMAKRMVDFTKCSPLSLFLEKRKIYKFYLANSKQVDVTCRYIVFFLHSQPEASTIPLGGCYAHQFTAVIQLAKAMPKDWVLYVKEHPSTFNELRYDLRYRSLDLYRLFLQLPNVRFVGLNVDNFHIIDSAQYVATITGTAGLQAICRGKNVIVFGDADYASVNGVFPIEKSVDLKKVFQEPKIPYDDVLVSVREECSEALHKSFTTLSDNQLQTGLINRQKEKVTRQGQALSAYLARIVD